MLSFPNVFAILPLLLPIPSLPITTRSIGLNPAVKLYSLVADEPSSLSPCLQPVHHSTCQRVRPQASIPHRSAVPPHSTGARHKRTAVTKFVEGIRAQTLAVQLHWCTAALAPMGQLQTVRDFNKHCRTSFAKPHTSSVSLRIPTTPRDSNSV